MKQTAIEASYPVVIAFPEERNEKKKKKRKEQMRVQLTRNNFATGPAVDHFYPWRNVGRLEGRVGVSERELERRLKLDLLISAGNVAVALSVSYLIKPSFRNSHATICHRCNQ